MNEIRTDGSEPRTLSSEGLHTLNNHLGIIQGFVDLVLEETPDTDPRRNDLLEIKQAVTAALALVAPTPHRV